MIKQKKKNNIAKNLNKIRYIQEMTRKEKKKKIETKLKQRHTSEKNTQTTNTLNKTGRGRRVEER